MSETIIEEARVTDPAGSPGSGLFLRLVRLVIPPGLRLSGAAIQFLSTILIARQLGDESSAGFFFWAAVLTSFTPVASYGLEHLVLRAVPRLHSDEKRPQLAAYLTSIRIVTLLLAVVIGTGLFVYALFRNDTGHFQFHLWQLILPIALSAMTIILLTGETLKGLSRPVAGVFFGHFVPVSLFCLLIVLNRENLSSPFLVVLYSTAYVIGVFIVRFGPKKTRQPKLMARTEVHEIKAIMQEGFPVFLTNALGALCFIVPLMMLDFLRPPEEVSQVTTSFRISILFAILAAAIHGIFAPNLSRAAAISGNGRGVFAVYAKTTMISLCILGLPLGVGIAFPEWVMSIFGEEFRAASGILRLLLIFGFISLCLGPTLQLLLMTGNTRTLARLGAIKLTLAVILSVVLIPSLGGIGMVIALVSTYALEEVLSLAIVVWQFKREPNKHSKA